MTKKQAVDSAKQFHTKSILQATVFIEIARQRKS